MRKIEKTSKMLLICFVKKYMEETRLLSFAGTHLDCKNWREILRTAADRIPFGSGCLWGNQGKIRMLLRKSSLCAGKLRKIEGENAVKLLDGYRCVSGNF